MIKTILYAIFMTIISILLFLLKVTGMKLHIALGILAVIITIVYTLLIRKNLKEYSKKSLVMEILMRICLAVALISGFLLKPFKAVFVISIIHKMAAIFFVILLFVININKIFIKKSKG